MKTPRRVNYFWISKNIWLLDYRRHTRQTKSKLRFVEKINFWLSLYFWPVVILYAEGLFGDARGETPKGTQQRERRELIEKKKTHFEYFLGAKLSSPTLNRPKIICINIYIRVYIHTTRISCLPAVCILYYICIYRLQNPINRRFTEIAFFLFFFLWLHPLHDCPLFGLFQQLICVCLLRQQTIKIYLVTRPRCIWLLFNQNIGSYIINCVDLSS